MTEIYLSTIFEDKGVWIGMAYFELEHYVYKVSFKCTYLLFVYAFEIEIKFLLGMLKLL